MAARDRVQTETNIVDYEPSGATNDVEFTLIVDTTTSNLEVHSVKQVGSLAEGSALCVVNDSEVDIKLMHNSGTATNAAWRLLMASGADVVIAPRGMLWGKLIEESAHHQNGWWFENA